MAPDHTKVWGEINEFILQNVIPELQRILLPHFNPTLGDLTHIIHELHRHRRDAWKLSGNEVKHKERMRQQHANQRMKQVIF
jgi:hypothetical protein